MPIGASRLGFWSGSASITPSTFSVNESGQVNFSVTSFIGNGTMYWTVEQDFGAIDAADFIGGGLSGSVAITNNAGTFSLPITADQKTEGVESFFVKLRLFSTSGPVLASTKVITVNDTSLTSYSIVPSSTSISEGQTVTFNITVTSTPSETFYWTVLQMTGVIDGGDMPALSGSVNVVNNTGSFLITPILDAAIEGPESFRVQLRTGSTSGPIVATSLTVVINDASVAPVEQFPNEGFEEGATVTTMPGWVVLLQRIQLNGLSTILGVPTPTDPTPNPVSTAQNAGGAGSGWPNSPGDATSVSSATYTADFDTVDLPPNGGTRSIYLRNSATVNGGAILYGPALYSTNTVIAEVGDKISFYWRALANQDAYNVYAYLVNPNASPVKYIQLLDANATTNTGVGSTTSWAEAAVIIQPGDEGNYHFVFVNGGFDATFGTIVGSDLKIDTIKRYRAAQANFLSDVSIGQAPLTVNFTDLSIGADLSYEWDFDNSGTVDSTLKNPVYTYTTPGTYSVKLRAYNTFSTDTEIKTAFITVT